MARRALDEFGRIDVAVANAGVLRAAALADLDDRAWADVVEVDLTGVVRTFGPVPATSATAARW